MARKRNRTPRTNVDNSTQVDGSTMNEDTGAEDTGEDTTQDEEGDDMADETQNEQENTGTQTPPVEQSSQETPPAPPPVETPTTPPVEAPVTPPQQDTAPIEQTAPSSVVEVVEGDNIRVANLKRLLASFIEHNAKIAKDSREFGESARTIAAVAQQISRNPTQSVLTLFLNFFKENLEGCCSHDNFLKGCEQLGREAGLKVGFLYVLFNNMASGTKGRIDRDRVVSAFGGHDIINFYDRTLRIGL